LNFKNFDWEKAKCYALITAEVLGHPLYSVVLFFVLNSNNFHTLVSTNVYLIDRPLLVLLCLLVGAVRFGFFWIWLARADFFNVVQAFEKSNRAALFSLFFVMGLYIPVEGNVFGFIYAPVFLLSITIIMPTIWVMSFKNIRRVRKEILAASATD